MDNFFIFTAMSTTSLLGKRKRRPEKELDRTHTDKARSESPDQQDVNEIFRKAFEAKFKPLPQEEKVIEEVVAEAQNDHSDEDSAWSGISEDEEEVEVVQHTADATSKSESLSKREQRAFMVCISHIPIFENDTDSTSPRNLRHQIQLQHQRARLDPPMQQTTTAPKQRI